LAGLGPGGVAAAFLGQAHTFPFIRRIEAFHGRVVIGITGRLMLGSIPAAAKWLRYSPLAY
jgi:hypothetical protein